MANPLRSGASHCFGLLLARVPLGMYFFLAGLGKVQSGVGEFVTKAKGGLPHGVPPSIGEAYLYALPFLEMLTGAMAIVGFGTRIAGLLMTFMLISIMIGTGIDPKGGPFHTNFILLGVALMLVFTGPGHISIDGLFFGRRKMTPESEPEK